jgi:hypothetical protein
VKTFKINAMTAPKDNPQQELLKYFQQWQLHLAKCIAAQEEHFEGDTCQFTGTRLAIESFRELDSHTSHFTSRVEFLITLLGSLLYCRPTFYTFCATNRLAHGFSSMYMFGQNDVSGAEFNRNQFRRFGTET